MRAITGKAMHFVAGLVAACLLAYAPAHAQQVPIPQTAAGRRAGMLG